MSHIMQTKIQVRDVAAARAACQRHTYRSPSTKQSGCSAARRPAWRYSFPAGRTRPCLTSLLAACSTTASMAIRKGLEERGRQRPIERRHDQADVRRSAAPRDWRSYVSKLGLEARQARPIDAAWTGAGIRACCRLAALRDVPPVKSAQNFVPVAHTSAGDDMSGCALGPMGASCRPTNRDCFAAAT